MLTYCNKITLLHNGTSLKNYDTMKKASVNIEYGRKGGIKIKPSEVVRNGSGREYLSKISESRLAKAIKGNKISINGLKRS